MHTVEMMLLGLWEIIPGVSDDHRAGKIYNKPRNRIQNDSRVNAIEFYLLPQQQKLKPKN